jgi:uncharacterized protein
MMRSAPSAAIALPQTDTASNAAPKASDGSSPIPMPSAPIAAARQAAPTAQTFLLPVDPLFTAIDARNAQALRQALNQGISPNARNASGNPALTQAVTQRWADGVRILLTAGADRNAKNSKGHTASDVALELGYADMAELLAAPR